MKYKLILRWFTRVALLFLSFIGIATIVTHYTDPLINMSNQELQISWIFGIGGLSLFISSYFRILYSKDGRRIMKKHYNTIIVLETIFIVLILFAIAIITKSVLLAVICGIMFMPLTIFMATVTLKLANHTSWKVAYNEFCKSKDGEEE